MLVLTNNPLVAERLAQDRQHTASYHPEGYREVLVRARDLVHQGHRVLTHPLSGSVKPNETPYKSLGLSKNAGEGICMDSLLLMENAILAFGRFSKREREITQDMDADFQLVDWTLLSSALSASRA